MNKVELIKAMSTELTEGGMKTTQKDAAVYVDTIFGIIAKNMANGEDTKVSGFGTFTVVERAAREGRNPATGEALHIEASKAPKFKASSTLKAAVKNA